MGKGDGPPTTFGGYRKRLGEYCIFGKWNAFKNHKPLVSNTDVVEPRIFGSYHTPGGLERAGDGRISED